MANKQRNNESVELVEDQTELTQAELDQDETQQDQTEAQQEETQQEEPEQEPNIDPFISAVQTALEEADQSTGDVAEQFVATVRTAYQELPGIKAKNLAKAFLVEEMKRYLADLNGPMARVLMTLSEKAAVAAKGGAAPKKEIDPAQAYRDRLAALTLATYLASASAPDGVDAEAVSKNAQALANEAYAEALEVMRSEEQSTENPLIRQAIRIASSKGRAAGAPRTFTGTRRDIGAHIQEAFADAEVGTWMSVADIRKFKSTEYGDDTPSAGAITNRLEPKSGKVTLEGIVGEHRDGKLGGLKVA